MNTNFQFVVYDEREDLHFLILHFFCAPILFVFLCIFNTVLSITILDLWFFFYQMIASRRKTSEEYSLLPDGQEAHWEVVERILFIYAKLNPGQGYVQVGIERNIVYVYVCIKRNIVYVHVCIKRNIVNIQI